MKQHCKIAVVLDRSGSMNSVREDTIGGFNRFLKDQKAVDGSADISLYQFDHEYTTVYTNKNIQEAPELNAATYVARGSTALLDAIGRTINSVGATLANLPESERPNKVVIAIMTDGYENASREFTPDSIRKLIKQQENVYSWEFLFLGATLDAVDVAQDYGIKGASALSYNSAKTTQTFDTFSKAVTSVRSMNAQQYASLKSGETQVFSASDREDVK